MEIVMEDIKSENITIGCQDVEMNMKKDEHKRTVDRSSR